MLRLFYFGALLGLAALLSAPGFPQNPPAAKVAHVEQVSVHAGDQTDSALTVEILTSGARVAPNTQAITGPDRIIIDFPGALPAAALHALKVDQGALQGIRTGLFFNNPPITRVVLDLAEPQSYQISTTANGIVIKLNSGKLNPVKSDSAKLDPAKSNPVAVTAAKSTPATAAKLGSATFTLGPKPGLVAASSPVATAIRVPKASLIPNAQLAPATKTDAALAAVVPVAPKVAPVVSVAAAASVPATAPLLDPVAEEPPPSPSKPLVSVTFAKGMLTIHAEKATLAQVLFEVQRQTQADIGIPAGAEQEEVIADLGPASARDVLASLLNGSTYNFIFVGSEERLERVILTRRDPNIF
jgi:hypothetical protein